jgi:electron transfer flavoprotein beta subunit
LTIEKVAPPPERAAGRTVASVGELAEAIAAELRDMEAR